MSASGNGPKRELSGAILAGGQSSRMGRDKATTPVPGRDRTMIELVVAALATVAAEIVVVAPHRAGYERLGVPLVGDVSGPRGPLRGIAAGLRTVGSDRCFVLACDLPYVRTDLLRWMADLDSEADALIPVTHGTSRQGNGVIYQTLFAIYRKTCLPAIERTLAAGDPRTTSFLSAVNVETIPEAALRDVDPALESFANVNAPEDWLPPRPEKW